MQGWWLSLHPDCSDGEEKGLSLLHKGHDLLGIKSSQKKQVLPLAGVFELSAIILAL